MNRNSHLKPTLLIQIGSVVCFSASVFFLFIFFGGALHVKIQEERVK